MPGERRGSPWQQGAAHADVSRSKQNSARQI